MPKTKKKSKARDMLAAHTVLSILTLFIAIILFLFLAVSLFLGDGTVR